MASILSNIIGYVAAPFTGGASLALTDMGENAAASAWKWVKHRIIDDMRRDREAQVQSASNARNIIYGRTRVGNTIAYAESAGANKSVLHLICIHASHEIDGYEEIYFDDKLVMKSVDAYAGGILYDAWEIRPPYVGKAVIELFDGTQTAACASMVAASAGGWTADHKLLGLAYSHITLTYSEGTFPAGLPTIKAVIRGKKVLDTRTGLIAWSDNPAMCKRDYMLLDTDSGGMGCDLDEIGEALVIVEANICDQMVLSMVALDEDYVPVTPGVKSVYKPVVGAPSYEKRYTLNGQIVLDGAPTDFIKSMLSASAGEAIYSEGMWKIFAGAPSASVAAVDESWLNGGISFQTGSNKSDKNNTIKGTFTNSNDFWADTEFPEMPIGISTPPNAAYWTLVESPGKYNPTLAYAPGRYIAWGGKVYFAYSAITVPINTPPPSASYWVLVPLHDNSLQYPISTTIQRGGSVYTSTGIVPVSNPYLEEDGGEVLAANIVLPFTTGSSEAQRLAVIALRKSRLGFAMGYPCNHKAFKLEVMDVVTVNNDRMGLARDFRTINWEFSHMGGTNLALVEYDPLMWDVSPGDISSLVSPVITNLPDPWTVAAPTGFTAVEELYTGVAVANTKSKLNLSWVSAQASGTLYDIAFDGVIIQTIAETSYTINDLTPGTYDVSVRAKTSLGVVSVWVTIVKVVAGQNTPPATVAGFAASFAGNMIKLAWTANSEIDLAGYEIRTGASWAAGTILQAAIFSNGYSYRPTGSGAVAHWIKAFDTAGNESVTAATSSVTIPAAAPPTAIAPTGVLSGIDLAIAYPDTLDIDYCEIWAAASNSRDAATLVGVTRNGKFSHAGLGNAAIRYYWARTVNVFQQNSAWYPASSTAGVQGLTLANPTEVLKLLNADVTNENAAAYLAGTKSLINILDTRPMLFELGVVGPGVAATYTDAINQSVSEMVKNKGMVEALNSLVSGLLTAVYVPANTYVTGEYVTGSDSKIYRALISVPVSTPPPNATYWELTSDIITLVNTVQQNLDTATGTWTSTAASLTADVAALDNPTTGRVTLAETEIEQNSTNITLAGQSITGPLAFIAGAVVEPGIQIESTADVKGLEVTVSKTLINMDSANAAITLQAGRIDAATGRITSAEIAIDGANAAINLRATSAQLSAQVDILSDSIGLKLNATGTVGPGLAITWTDETHTRSNITVLSDTFILAKPDGTGQKNVFVVGNVNGVSTVGINAADMVVDGTLTANKIATGALIVGTNVALGTAQTAGQVTTIVGNTVTTGFINALNVTAQSVAAENITGTVITGKTVQTSATGKRIVMSGADELTLYDTDGTTVLASLGVGGPSNWWGIGSSSGYFHDPVAGNSAIIASGSIGVTSEGSDYGGVFGLMSKRTSYPYYAFVGLAQLVLCPGIIAGYPTWTARHGAVYMDVNCILYVQKTYGGGTDWQKVGAQ